MSIPDLASSVTLHSIYRDHHGWLIGFLRRKLGNVDQAADLAQDTFERIIRVPVEALLPEPRAYLTTVAKRLAISHFRRAALERIYLEELAARAEPVCPSPEAQLLALETLSEICEMLDSLDARARRVFLCAQLEGLSYPQVAQRLGMSLDQVKKTMSKALQHCYAIIYA